MTAARPSPRALERTAPPNGALARWADWARGHAEAIDPLSPAGFARLADNAVLAARISRPAAEPTADEQEWFDDGFLEPSLARLEDVRSGVGLGTIDCCSCSDACPLP